MSGNHKATPPKPKSDASRWTQKGTKDERRQRDHEMRQNAEIDDAAAKLQTFVDEEDGNQIHRVIETEGLPENIPHTESQWFFDFFGRRNIHWTLN